MNVTAQQNESREFPELASEWSYSQFPREKKSIRDTGQPVWSGSVKLVLLSTVTQPRLSCREGHSVVLLVNVNRDESNVDFAVGHYVENERDGIDAAMGPVVERNDNEGIEEKLAKYQEGIVTYFGRIPQELHSRLVESSFCGVVVPQKQYEKLLKQLKQKYSHEPVLLDKQRYESSEFRKEWQSLVRKVASATNSPLSDSAFGFYELGMDSVFGTIDDTVQFTGQTKNVTLDLLFFAHSPESTKITFQNTDRLEAIDGVGHKVHFSKGRRFNLLGSTFPSIVHYEGKVKANSPNGYGELKLQSGGDWNLLRGHFQDGLLQGKCFVDSSDGVTRVEANFKDGVATGSVAFFNRSGYLYEILPFKDGNISDGQYTRYRPDPVSKLLNIIEIGELENGIRRPESRRALPIITQLADGAQFISSPTEPANTGLEAGWRGLLVNDEYTLEGPLEVWYVNNQPFRCFDGVATFTFSNGSRATATFRNRAVVAGSGKFYRNDGKVFDATVTVGDQITWEYTEWILVKKRDVLSKLKREFKRFKKKNPAFEKIMDFNEIYASVITGKILVSDSSYDRLWRHVNETIEKNKWLRKTLEANTTKDGQPIFYYNSGFDFDRYFGAKETEPVDVPPVKLQDLGADQLEKTKANGAHQAINYALATFEGWDYGTYNTAQQTIDCTSFLSRFIENQIVISDQAADRVTDRRELRQIWNGTNVIINELHGTPQQRRVQLYRLLDNGDVRMQGVVNALASRGRGTVIDDPADARPGDLVQYWRYRDGEVIEGHAGVLEGVVNRENGRQAQLYGSHRSLGGIGTQRIPFENREPGDNRSGLRIFIVRPSFQ